MENAVVRGLVILAFDPDINERLVLVDEAGIYPDQGLLGVVVATAEDRNLVTQWGYTALSLEEAVVAMGEWDDVFLIANAGAIALQAPLLMAAATLPHVHVVNVQPDGVTVLRAGATGVVEMVVACTKAMEALAEKRAHRLRGALSSAELVHTNRRIPGSTDPEEIARYEQFQNEGEFQDLSLQVHDWRGNKADPEEAKELEQKRETTEFVLTGLRVIIHDSLMSTEREPMTIYFLDLTKR